MTSAISVSHLNKTYASGFQALKDINLDIRHGEIFALLGPNGAGKTTLISIICGIVNPTTGKVTVDGHDIVARLPRRALADRAGAAGAHHRRLRDAAGDLAVFAAACSASRPIRPSSRKCSRSCRCGTSATAKIRMLSGGMKRRLMIAKALAHEPRILFLDEPTAGVDVELRKDMWQLVRELRASGVTIILTTHYIEEAEEMADRVGVINNGEIILVEDKAELMRKLGKKQLTLELRERLDAIPPALAQHHLSLAADGNEADLHLRHQRRAHRHHGLARRSRPRRHQIQGSADHAKLAGGYFRRPGEASGT